MTVRGDVWHNIWVKNIVPESGLNNPAELNLAWQAQIRLRGELCQCPRYFSTASVRLWT
jgi:hypothetical protein